MRKLTKNESGFSAVEVLVIIVIVGLLGAAGWLVYGKQKADEPTAQSTTVATTEKTTEEPTDKVDTGPTEGWLAYTSQNKKYIISLPDGWVLNSLNGGDNLDAWSSSDITFTEGEDAKVNVTEGGRDGSSIAFFLIYDYKANEGSYLSSNLKKEKTYTTGNQVAVSKYTRTQTGEPEGMDIPKGAKEYAYDLVASNKKIHITHDILPGETDQSQRIEQMIETLKFL